MKPIRRTELVETVESAEGYVVSIYITVQIGADSRQQPIRLKNLLRAAQQKLRETDTTNSEIQALLTPARELLDQPNFWRELGHGLAILLSRSGMHLWELPYAGQERCVVGKNYFVLPLLVALAEDTGYYVLAVSQNEVRLLQGTRGEIAELEVPGLPINRQQALNLDQPEPALQAHVTRAQVPGKGDLMYHGHGGAPDDAKDEIEAYFREIDRAVANYLQLETEPLVFAGVDYLFPIFQEVNHYPHLLPTPITGNPELWTPTDLRQKAWPLVECRLDERRENELSKYGNLISQGRTLDRLEEILIAAHAGAVETLFVDPSAERFGAFFPGTSTVRIDQTPQDDSEELINLAATFVLRSRGMVETLASDEVPDGGDVAATLRYAFPAVVSK